MKNTRIGETYITNEGYKITIIDYKNIYNCDVIFSDGTILYNKKYWNIVKGQISHPFHKTVYGIGFMGEGPYSSSLNNKQTKNHRTWSSMFTRCYNEKYHLTKPTYKDCSVCPEWHNFQNFAKWYDENYINDFHLDKDLLIKNNKIYSPEKCCFLPSEINSSLNKNKNVRGNLPIGVRKSGNKFYTQSTINGIRISSKLFDTIEEAFLCYKNNKENELKRLSDKYKNILPNNVYNALLNYKIEITD